jgi:hypothetical protein
MVPRQARWPPAGMDMAKGDAKNCQNTCYLFLQKVRIQTKICPYISLRHSKIKN